MRKNLNTYTLKIWQDYIDPIIEVRKKLNNPNVSPLLKVMNSGKTDALQRLIEKVVKNVKNAHQIFEITNQLKNNDCDERINDMIGELRGAAYLINEGHQNIEYQKKTVDFASMLNNKKNAIEIEFLRGPHFKNQKRIGPIPVYKLDPDPVRKNIKNKVEHGYTQIHNFKTTHFSYQGIVIVVTNRLEWDKPWFGEDINEFRKQLEKEKNIRIVILPDDNNIYQ